MTRETALQILTKHLSNKVLLKHSLAVEAVMRSLAPMFKGDIEEWGIAGLLHDADYDEAKGQPERHGFLLFQLEPNMIPSVVEHAIKSHNFEDTHIAPESPMDWALYCCDDLTGIITELAQAQKEKVLSSISSQQIVQELLEKHKNKKNTHLAAFLSEEKLGIPLEQFVILNLKAMQAAHEELGL